MGISVSDAGSTNYLLNQLALEGYAQPIFVDLQSGKATQAGKEVEKEKVDTMLAQRDVVVRGGEFFSVSGVPIAAATATAMTTIGGPPPLPSISRGAAPQDVLAAVDMLRLSDSVSEGSLLWEQLKVLLKGAQEDVTMQRELRTTALKQKMAAKDSEIGAKKAKVEAMIQDAKDMLANAQTQFAISCVVAAATCAAACYSTASTVVGALGSVANSFGSYLTAKQQADSWENGAKHDAAKADIDATLYQKAQEVADAVAEDAKAGSESAKELFKLALKVIREVEERRSQNVSALTRI